MADMNEQTKEAVEGAVNATKDVANAATDTLSKSVSNMTNAVSDNITNTGVLYGLLVVVVVAIVCGVIIYYFIVDGVFNKQSITIEKTKVPVKGYEKSEIDIDSMPSSGNGKRRSMTFWIYLNDMNNSPGQYKRVFSIGDGKSLSDSPVVILDANENKMYIRYMNEEVHQDVKNINVNGLDGNKIKMFQQNAITIDYVPLQRWVHIAVVVNDGINGGTMTVYIDGEVAKSVVNGDYVDPSDKEGSGRVKINNMELDRGGKLVVGGNGANGEEAGFNGLLSKVTIFNYDLNSNDVYANYNQGPVSGMLAALGIGIRSPIYKL